MKQTTDSNESANSQANPAELRSPKRGAFPSPRSDVEQAPPYVVETDRTDENSASSETPPQERPVEKRS